jgi:ribonuclease HI
MPAPLKTTIQQIVGCTKERFSSPLTVQAGTAEYWTVHKQDQVFGARCDAYKAQWTGASMACPDFTEEQATKAVKWALQSAIQTDIPTMTILLLPTHAKEHSTTGHMKWIKQYPEWCKHLLTLPKSKVRLHTPPNTRGPVADTLKWNTQLVAIGNRAGYEKYLPYWKISDGMQWRHKFRQAIQTALETATGPDSAPIDLQLTDEQGSWWSAPPTQPKDTTLTLPSSFRKRPQDNRHEPRSQRIEQLLNHNIQATGALPRAVRAANSALEAALPSAPPLRYDWTEFIYTDGSALTGTNRETPGIGAGVYIPANTRLGREERVVPIGCMQEGVPGHPPGVNTINRAELAAIDIALQTALADAAAEPNIHIATDSLASIYQVRKANTRPQDLREHRHLNIINKIAKAIESHTGVVHLWKVRSHIGIVGNEIADETAVAVSNGVVAEDETSSYLTPSNNRSDMYWLYEQAEAKPKKGTPAGIAQAEPEHVFTPLSNITDALKAHTHKLRKLGSSNQDTIYFKSWTAARPTMDQKHSHLFMTSTTVKSRQRKLAIQYRYGLLPTNKLLHRYKKAPSNKCPLCGLDDGGHHAVSGCRQLSEPVTLRHNTAASAIVEAINAGTKGGLLISADVGVNKRRRAKGLPQLDIHRGVPESVLPPGMPTGVKAHLKTQSVPDALLYEYDKKRRRRQYTIVEVKYCRDTRPADQEARAAQQHAELLTTIREYDPDAKVAQCNLMLGVGGAIPTSTVTHLREDLGVEGAKLEALTKQLHFTAIEHLERIWICRRAKIKNRLGQTKKPAIGSKRGKHTAIPAHRTTLKKKKLHTFGP